MAQSVANTAHIFYLSFQDGHWYRASYCIPLHHWLSILNGHGQTGQPQCLYTMSIHIHLEWTSILSQTMCLLLKHRGPCYPMSFQDGCLHTLYLQYLLYLTSCAMSVHDRHFFLVCLHADICYQAFYNKFRQICGY